MASRVVQWIYPVIHPHLVVHWTCPRAHASPVDALNARFGHHKILIKTAMCFFQFKLILLTFALSPFLALRLLLTPSHNNPFLVMSTQLVLY